MAHHPKRAAGAATEANISGVPVSARPAPAAPFISAELAHNVRYENVTDVVPPETLVAQAIELLLDLDRTTLDVRRGYLRHRTLLNANATVLPAAIRRLRGALAEMTGGEQG